MKEVIRMTLTRREHGVLLHALNELRNHMIEQSMPTEGVDAVFLKVIDASEKRPGRKHEAR
ncbi:MAG TPA: hypothetical protein H9710_04275 [Candidatus Acutalibacter pullicola]|uniref:Uncharacterized protein n=1 Tax=Candidatus Acutalibacter pullicola TaxID=2838417 RepID=A0A9D2MUD4_9FIRM|nr:hypothetical protein [Candidatus Acutalibacter pullicola]